MIGSKSLMATWWLLLLNSSGVMNHRFSFGRIHRVSALASMSFVPRHLGSQHSRRIPLLVGQPRESSHTSVWKVRGGQQEQQHRFYNNGINARSLTALKQAATTSEAVSESALQQIAKETLPIMGDSLQIAKFGGQSYWDTSSFKEFRVLFVLGGPGAGKGTQSALLEDNYPVVHLSVGELLREEQSKEDSPHRALIEECLVGGKIVPVEISIALLQQAMQDAASKKSESLLFLVDGFPRNFDNLEGWVRCMNGVSSVWGVLVYKCPLEELERRILKRAETSGRSDDNVKSAKKRFKTFETETMPVVEVLKIVQDMQQQDESKPALRVMEMEGNQSIDEVWSDTQDVMNRFLAHDVWTANAQLLNAIQEGDVDLYSKLVSPDLLGENDKKEIMQKLEGSPSTVEISNPQMQHISGTKIIVSYDRPAGEHNEVLRESRVWSHQATGWVNVHFSRSPL